MGRILTIARHTIREAMRMKIVGAFIFLLVLMLIGLPLGLRKPDATVSYTVQTFLSWSLTLLGVILSFLAIFLGCLSISDEMYHRQIYTLMTKPVPRWQYVVGKWAGVVGLLTGLLLLASVSIYGMTWYLASRPPLDQDDADMLKNQILTARAGSKLQVPDFTAQAEIIFQRMVEEGRYTDADRRKKRDVVAEKRSELAQQWRSVPPGARRLFEFKNLRVSDRSDANKLQLRYKAKGLGYAQDEVLQMVWWFGHPGEAKISGPLKRNDVMDRFHVIEFPASAVSPEGTLKVVVQNIDHLRPGSRHRGATISFEAQEGFEVLFKIGSFEGNMIRTLFLIWCRVALICAIGICAATLVSYPVACLITFMFYILAVSAGYVIDALDFGKPGEGVLGPAHFVMAPILEFIFWVWPKFSEYNGVEVFVDGRVVSLMWNIRGFGKLVLLLSTIFLVAGCLIFRRRQLAELSV